MDHIDARVVALQVIEARKKSQNAYDCLLLPRTASFADVRAAYKRLLFLHPDKNPTLDVAHEAFKIVRSSFDEIKNSQDLAGGITNAAPVGNKWGAYTSAQAVEQAVHVDIPRGGIPSAAPQPPPPPSQQPTAWTAQNSKWGRPSTETNRLLKVFEPSTSRLKPASRPQSLDSKELADRHAAVPSMPENDLSKPSSGTKPAHNESEDVIEIDCGSFYGDKSRSKAVGKNQREKQQQQQQERRDSLPSSSGAAAAAAAAAAPQGWKEGGVSKWSDASRNNPLAELLRNPEAATTTAPVAPKDLENPFRKNKKRAALKTKNTAANKRQTRTRVVIDSDSDDAAFNNLPSKAEEKELVSAESSSGSEDNGGRGGGGDSISSDGWDSQDEDFKEEEIVSEAAGEAKSKAWIQLLLAQQRSQAKHRLQAGAAATAKSQRAAFGSRRGGKKRRQTRLKLAPITSK